MPQPTITGILIDSGAIGTSTHQGLSGSVDFVLQDDGGTQDSELPDITHGGPIQVYVEVPDTQTETPIITGSFGSYDTPGSGSQEEPCAPPEIITPSALMNSPKAFIAYRDNRPPSTSGFSWYSDDCGECCNPVTDRIINYLKLKVVTFTSPAYTPRLAASYDPEPIVKEAVLRGHAVAKTISLKDHSAGSLSRVASKKRKDGTTAYKFRYGATFPKTSAPLDHLEVATYLTVDYDKMAEDFDINTFGEIQKQAIPEVMNFKTSIEKVITKGKVVEESYIFYDKNTKQYWDGPVHYHPPVGFMAGEKHGPFSHASLQVKKVPNLKVKDHSVKRELLNLDLSSVLKSKQLDDVADRLNSSTDKGLFLRSLVSEPIGSRTRDGQTRFLFYVDQKNLVKNLSRFPGLEEDAIYNAASLKNLSIFRHRGSESKNKNAFGTDKASNDKIENQTTKKDLIVSAADERSNQLASSKNRLVRSTRTSNRNDRVETYRVGSVEEINVNGLERYRVFSVTDSEISDFQQGKYQYSVEMKFEDPAITYLNQKLKDLCTAKTALQEISYISSTDQSYDILNDRFSDKYAHKNGKKHMNVVRNALMAVAETLSLVTRRTPRRVINYFLSQSSLQTGSPQGIQDLIDVMNSFERKMTTLLGENISFDRMHNAKSTNKTKIFSKDRSGKGILDFAKDFDFIVDRSINDDFGIDYVQASGQSFPAMSTKDYRKRQEAEMQKYFSRTQTRTSQTTINKNLQDPAQTRAVTNLGNSYSFLTPASISVGSQPIRLIGQDSEIDNIEKQNEIVSKMVKKNSADSKAYFKKDDTFSLSLDTLAAIGISAYTEQTKKERENALKDKYDEGYTQNTKAIFGERSFNENNIDKVTGHDPQSESDVFVMSAINKTAVAINDRLAQTGVLTGEAPINQDQEINTRGPKTDFLDKLSIKQFDLDNDNNIVKKIGSRRVSKLPPSIKSLFVCREQGTRNWLDFEKDLIQDPELKNIYRLNHSNVVKLEYLDSVATQRFGASTKDMVYKPLTSAALRRAPILVRITPVTIPEVGVGTDSGTKTETYTENFLIGASRAKNQAKTRRTSIATRKKQRTNYITAQMDRLVFSEPSEITTHLIKKNRGF